MATPISTNDSRCQLGLLRARVVQRADGGVEVVGEVQASVVSISSTKITIGAATSRSTTSRKNAGEAAAPAPRCGLRRPTSASGSVASPSWSATSVSSPRYHCSARQLRCRISVRSIMHRAHALGRQPLGGARSSGSICPSGARSGHRRTSPARQAPAARRRPRAGYTRRRRPEPSRRRCRCWRRRQSPAVMQRCSLEVVGVELAARHDALPSRRTSPAPRSREEHALVGAACRCAAPEQPGDQLGLIVQPEQVVAQVVAERAALVAARARTAPRASAVPAGDQVERPAHQVGLPAEQRHQPLLARRRRSGAPCRAFRSAHLRRA